MKKVVFLIAVFCAVASSVAIADGTSKARHRGRAKASGGIVEKTYRGDTLRIVNAQTAIDSTIISGLAQKMRYSSQLPIEVATDVPTDKSLMAFAAKQKDIAGIGASVIVVDDATLPILLSSLDGRWAILNVATFKGDTNKLDARMHKALWAAVAHSLGAGSTGDKGCVLTPFSNVAELDAIAATEPSPIAHNGLLDVAKASGINTLFFASYRTACLQGWAPAPTNDVQQQIWDEIHTLPTEPLKIKPETKKQEK